MNQHNLEKLQAELMVIGTQLLHNAGVRVNTNEARKAVSQWARVQAEPLARRLRL